MHVQCPCPRAIKVLQVIVIAASVTLLMKYFEIRIAYFGNEDYHVFCVHFKSN